jgi:hypothetical protein
MFSSTSIVCFQHKF